MMTARYETPSEKQQAIRRGRKKKQAIRRGRKKKQAVMKATGFKAMNR